MSSKQASTTWKADVKATEWVPSVLNSLPWPVDSFLPASLYFLPPLHHHCHDSSSCPCSECPALVMSFASCTPALWQFHQDFLWKEQGPVAHKVRDLVHSLAMQPSGRFPISCYSWVMKHVSVISHFLCMILNSNIPHLWDNHPPTVSKYSSIYSKTMSAGPFLMPSLVLSITGLVDFSQGCSWIQWEWLHWSVYTQLILPAFLAFPSFPCVSFCLFCFVFKLNTEQPS